MDRQIYSETLTAIAQKIFEDAAFALVDEPEDDELEYDDGSMMAVAVDFTGSFSGTTAILTGRGLAVMFAANMLGIDEEDPEAVDRSVDALKEIVNMLCGNFLPAVAGKELEFRIEVPREVTRQEFSGIENNEFGESVTGTLYVEGFVTRLAYYERNK